MRVAQGFSSSSRGAGGPAQAVRKKAPPLEHTSLRASIEKIGMALEDAVAAAVAQGMAAGKWMCVCVCVRVCARSRVCVLACVLACVCARGKEFCGKVC
eukprot:1142194-Pelagomonas_calceolata.AAC.7